MGDVVPFLSAIQRMRDWTPAERGRLQEIARTLSSDGSPIRVEFGNADDGNPWCVILDDKQDTLVHAARINGRFIVHRVADDVLEEGADLQSVVDAALGLRWDEARDDVVVAFDAAVAQSRRAQTIAALIVVTAFYETTTEAVLPVVEHRGDKTQHNADTDGPPALLEQVFLASEEPPLPPRGPGGQRSSSLATTGEWLLAAAPEMAQGATVQNTSAYAALTPASFRPMTDGAPLDFGRFVVSLTEDFNTVQQGGKGNDRLEGSDGRDLLDGGEGDDILVGGGGADILLGGAGDDVLIGNDGQPEGADLLDGGAGRDLLYLAAGAIGTGGSGADTFTVAPGTAPGDQPMAIILDFAADEGDSITLLQVPTATIISVSPTENLLAGLTSPPSAAPAPPGPVSGERIGVDTNADGKEDGFLLVNGSGNASAIGASGSEAGSGFDPSGPIPAWSRSREGIEDSQLLDWAPDAAPLI